MTSSNDKQNISINPAKCGRLGCVTIYSTRNCYACNMVEEIVKNVASESGLSEDIVNSISDEEPIDQFLFDSIYGIPSVRICDVVINGIPDENEVRDALRRAHVLSCFLSDIT